MAIQKSMNTDVPGRISELQAMMKEFLLKHKLYKLLLRGKGLEFEAFRNYAPDDDASAIDWKASKRANNILVKQYRDERNLKIVFLVDVGENMISGSTEKLKCEYGAEVVASFAHLITTTGDKVGAIFFSQNVKEYMGPSSGSRRFHKLVDMLTNPETYGGPSDLNVGLNFALSYLGKNIDSLVIVSDFTAFNQQSAHNLELLAQKFETLVLMLRDPVDRTLPDFSGEVAIQNPQTGEQLLVDPKIARNLYEQNALEQEKLLEKICTKNDIDFLPIVTNTPFVPTLAEFLKARIKRKEGR